jgi:hypothetical protein
MKLGLVPLVARFDAQTLTFVGVINKVDKIDDPEMLAAYQKIAGNEDPAQHLTHGYFVTRLAKPDELSLEWKTLREKEDRFFEDNSSWRDAGIRCGTGALTERLSEMLCEAIAAR